MCIVGVSLAVFDQDQISALRETVELISPGVDMCTHKAKNQTCLKQHKASRHDIGVTWRHCDMCDYKTEKDNNLKRHKVSMHDIGISIRNY